MRLLLIRHGQTPSNVAGAIDTAVPGAELTDLGHKQAESLPAALAEEPLAALYASRLVRTQLTAGPLSRHRRLDVRVQSGLEEVSAGDLEMRTDETAVRAYADCLAAWMLGDLTRSVPGGQDGRSFAARYDGAVRTIARNHTARETVAVVSHGAAIRVFTALRALDVDPEAATELSIMNTGGALLEGHPDEGWRLRWWSTEPLGGPELAAHRAHDVTGESAEEAMAEGD